MLVGIRERGSKGEGERGRSRGLAHGPTDVVPAFQSPRIPTSGVPALREWNQPVMAVFFVLFRYQ